VALCGMLVAVLLAGGMPIVPALAITILTGALAGAVIGLITALAEVPSFIVSLAGLVSFRGITYLLTDGVPVSGLPPSFGAISSTMVPVLPGLQVSSMGIIFVVLCIAAGALLRLTVFGESVYATGGNAEAARLSGLPTTRILVLVFTVSGVMSALAGILLTSRLRIGQPTAAQGLELDAIAAVVLGGTSLFGGRGGVLGTFFAVMLLQVLRNIFNLLGLGSFYQMTVTGLIIVAAILLNRFIDIRRGRA
jgi:ribose transport system permease protein